MKNKVMKDFNFRGNDSRSNVRNVIHENTAGNSKGAFVQKRSKNAVVGKSASQMAQLKSSGIGIKSEEGPINRFHALKAEAKVYNNAATSDNTAIQKKQVNDEEIQMKVSGLDGNQIQRKVSENEVKANKVVQSKSNDTGLPDNLKSGVENLSGYAMDDVKVHFNSAEPAQLGAHAYAQGTDIHVAPGQEKHLPHEAWHVAQQKQGRVKPTMQMKAGVSVNDDASLENEADAMGAKALGVGQKELQNSEPGETSYSSADQNFVQMVSVESKQSVTLPNGIIQMVKDMESAYQLGAKRGGGLTDAKFHKDYGHWHFHVISDDENLGLIEKVFIKFEDKPGAQHLLVDKDGNPDKSLALHRNGDKMMIDWGYQQIDNFLAQCKDVSNEEIVERRRIKEEKEKKDKEALAKLPPIVGPSKHDYGENNLFAASSEEGSEERAIQMLGKAGIDKTNKDFNIIKAKVKDNTPKEKWPSFIRQYYDQIYQPIVIEVVEKVDDKLKEEEPKPVTNSSTMDTEPIVKMVLEQIQENKPQEETQNMLLKIGIPMAIIIALFALIMSLVTF
jgi:hypothetical protein